MGCLKLKTLKDTRDFYQVELKKEDLTERQINKYLNAQKLIEGFIEKEKKLVIYSKGKVEIIKNG